MSKNTITDDQLFALVREADRLPASGGAAADAGAELLRRLLSTPRRPLVGAPVQEPRSLRLRPRHALVALAVAVAIAVPAVAFADAIGHLLGLSNQGTPVPASTLSKDTSLARAMQELGFPSTLQLLGTRDGISFYAVRKPGGQFCFAVTDASSPAGARRAASDVGRDGAFPSAEDPVSVSWVGGRFAGFAADGVASVAVVDASGATIATADVRDNLFVGGSAKPPTAEITVESRDANGNVLSTIHSQRVEAGDASQPYAQRAAHLHAFAECMHKHGVPNFPDPTEGQFPRNNTGQIASPRIVQAALKTCFPVSQGAFANPGAAGH
jgi:hypothetical protein